MGTFLLTTGLVLILLALSFGGVEFAWKSGYIIQNFLVGGFLIIAFIIWTFKYSPNPMILPIFIKNSPFYVLVFLHLQILPFSLL